METTATLTRYRIEYHKTDALRYTGHLDLHHAWEKTLRRGNLPLAYSQGFHPQPRLQQACALPLGFTSRAEIIDIWLDFPFEIENLTGILNRSVPPGIAIMQVSQIDLHAPPAQTLVEAAEYQVQFLDPVDTEDLSAKISALLAAESVMRERRGKTYDLRPLIQKIELLPAGGGQPSPFLAMTLSALNNATGRPEEVLLALGVDPLLTKIERTRLILRG